MGFWNQKTFCLITGASRGIGRSIAVEFGQKVGKGSVFVLVARSATDLEETKSEILSSGVEETQVITATLDLGQSRDGAYLDLINAALASSGNVASDFQLSLLVHNAGSVGNISLRLIQMDSAQELRDYFEFNLLSMILLTSEFFKVFRDEAKERSVVQISSLAGVLPFKSLSVYGIGKAGRDMVMKSIAAEDPSISTLSYAPGPVDTEMFSEVLTKSGDTDVVQQFEDTKASGAVLTPIQTIAKLVRILGERKYTKGEHVDYYEISD